jgi:hypothetical protein
MKKPPKWAQEAALKIWIDIESCGMPTKKGIPDIVEGLWAKIIADSAPRRKK